MLLYWKNIQNIENKSVPKIILMSSYYPNKTCANIKDTYIKLIGVSGKVSVSNIPSSEISLDTPMDIFYNLIRFDKKITFYSAECNKTNPLN